MRLKSDSSPKARGVLDHEAAKSPPLKYRRAPGHDHLKEFLDGQVAWRHFPSISAD